VGNESDAARIARLEERSESILRELQRISREMEQVVGPQAGELIKLVAELASLADDFEEFRRELTQRAGMSTTLKVALISGCFALAGTLIVAIAQIVGGS
jgi:hypothetical protein